MLGEESNGETKNGRDRIAARSEDPGARRHGNFMNYYQFHSAEERTRQLPRGDVWRPTSSRQGLPHDRKYIGLDVGCNTGDLTVELHKFIRREFKDDQTSVHMLGIDIDPVLIERARCSHPAHSDHVTFECLDFTNESQRSRHLQNYLGKFGRQRFDAVFCFSVTMWIHLNHGDEGLVNYLETCATLADRMIVIEPQSWKCYRNASRRLRRAGHEDFSLINSLKLTGDVAAHIDRAILERCPFERLAITEPNDWGRNLLVYERSGET